MESEESGVGTETQEKSGVEKKIEEAKESLTDLEVLEGPCRKYTIAGKKLIQKPLVLRDFGRLFEHIVEMLSIVASVHPEAFKAGFEIDTDNLSPSFLLGIASGSKEMMEKVYDIVSMVLNEDRDFLLDNLHLKEFSAILADAIELNDLKDIIANFQRMGHQVKDYFQKKI